MYGASISGLRNLHGKEDIERAAYRIKTDGFFKGIGGFGMGVKNNGGCSGLIIFDIVVYCKYGKEIGSNTNGEQYQP